MSSASNILNKPAVYSELHATFQKIVITKEKEKKGVTSTVSSKVMRVTLVNLKLSTLQV